MPEVQRASDTCYRAAETLDVTERDRKLAEPLVVRIDRLDAGDVQQRVYSSVEAGPSTARSGRGWADRFLRIESQDALPQRVGDGRHGHRRSGISGIRLLNAVHGRRADRVHAELVETHSRSEEHTSELQSLRHLVCR